MLLEDIATAPLDELGDESDRLLVLAAVDAMPLVQRAELGRTVVDWLTELSAGGSGSLLWRLRSLIWHGRPYLILGAASRGDADVRAGFEGLVALRHAQFGERDPRRATGLTVGILLTPRSDRRPSWDTNLAAARGSALLEPADRAVLERAWGPFGGWGPRSTDDER